VLLPENVRESARPVNLRGAAGREEKPFFQCDARGVCGAALVRRLLLMRREWIVRMRHEIKESLITITGMTVGGCVIVGMAMLVAVFMHM